jgi:hypothetical protein
VGKSLESKVLATKFPEQVYAQWDSATNAYKPAQWTITVVNTGTGSAFNVEVVETLGNDLAYLGSFWIKSIRIFRRIRIGCLITRPKLMARLM